MAPSKATITCINYTAACLKLRFGPDLRSFNPGALARSKFEVSGRLRYIQQDPFAKAIAGGAQFGKVVVMGDDDQGLAACVCKFEKQLMNLPRCLTVQIPRRFVGKNDIWIVTECPIAALC
jgi:hypothetical protein